MLGLHFPAFKMPLWLDIAAVHKAQVSIFNLFTEI